MKPGPAFVTSYDNKYNQWDVFATDDGRYKNALNTNKHDDKILMSAEKAEYQAKLKLSSIKFDQDEMGSPLTKADRLNQTLNPSMDYSPQKTGGSIFNKKQSAVTNIADHQTGHMVMTPETGTRSQTSHNRSRQTSKSKPF